MVDPIDPTSIPSALRPAQVAALESLSTPLISDCMDRLVGISGLRGFHRGGKLTGTAFRPGDNLGMYQALP